MCLAVPSMIVSKEGHMAVVDVFGARKEGSLELVSGDIQVGDYVLVYAGFAIQKLDREESIDTLQLFRELTEIMGGAGESSSGKGQDQQ
jgi:hydrogenase expression/formation protein HypC